MDKKIVQTAGRDQLGSFAPEFAHFNDDVLFGENWNNPDIDLKTRSIIVISVFMGRGLADSSLKYHLLTAKNTASPKRRSPRLSPTPDSMPGGPWPGRHSTWQRKCGQRTSLP